MRRNPTHDIRYGLFCIKRGLKDYFKLLWKYPKCMIRGHDYKHVTVSEETDWDECKRCGCLK